MAQTKKRRRRKHRGTQGGRVDTKRPGRPRTRAEAQQRARTKRTPRADLPPTWRSAITRGIIISVLLVVTLLLFRKPIGASIGFGLFMLAFYIPMGFYIDRFMWRRRQLAKMKDR